MLALASGLGNVETRRAVLDALPRVARIGTHLFHFLEYVEGVRGWGRLLRNAVGSWYNDMDADRLAYQAVKYQSRDGWSHRDALRLAKPVPPDALHDAIYGWIAKGWDGIGPELPDEKALQLLWVYERAKRATAEADVLELIRTHSLTWEFVPAQWLGSAEVWKASLPNLPLTALMRNLGRMSANGALTPLSVQAREIEGRLADGEAIHRARLHPLSLLVAMTAYSSGKGVRGGLTWEPLPNIVDALDHAFYLSFDNVEPTGKRIMMALDVSGSMTFDSIAGMPGITPRDASAALALVTARTEANHVITGFTAGGDDVMDGGASRMGSRWTNAISLLNISPNMRLADAVKAVSNLPFGGTDCALPMLYALRARSGDRRLRCLHGQRDVGGRYPPVPGAADVSRAHAHPGSPGGGGHDVQRLQHCRPGRRRHAGRGGHVHSDAGADQRLHRR